MGDSELRLQQLVELLGSRDWRVVGTARDALVGAGSAGMEAVIRGLFHRHPSVRRGCAHFMDHQGTEACVGALCAVGRHDPVAYVRRVAVHSVGCQRCKPSPLQSDTVAFLIERALSDANMRVRCEAVSGLSLQQPDPRAAAALRTILDQETDRALLRVAHHALQRHDAAYREATIEKAKARAQAIHESSWE